MAAGRIPNGLRITALCVATSMAGMIGPALAYESPAYAEAGVLESSRVDGTALGEWTARWWRWAFSQPVPPYLDRDGRDCASAQAGPVWFLAGTDGRFVARRTCAIPLGKHVLVPVINMIHFARGDRPDTPCSELQSGAAVNNDRLTSAVVMLDGKVIGDIDKRRVRSEGCFRLDPADATSALAAADGYWLMLKPLPRGRHTLVVGANYGDTGASHGGMHQNFEYVLEVGGALTLSHLDAGIADVEAAP